MKKICLIIAGFLLAAQVSFAECQLPEKFVDGLERAGMTFEMPEGYTEIEVVETPHMRYEYAIKHDKADFEVRYAIRPIDEMLQRFHDFEKNKKEGETMIDPNKAFEAVPLSVLLNIAENLNQMQSFPLETVRNEFNADKGEFVIVEVKEGFGNGYKHCMMVSILKKNKGVAFYFYMTNDPELFQKLLSDSFYSLRFKDDIGPATQE